MYQKQDLLGTNSSHFTALWTGNS